MKINELKRNTPGPNPGAIDLGVGRQGPTGQAR